jgi:deoxyribose-phosphate aldolase
VCSSDLPSAEKLVGQPAVRRAAPQAKVVTEGDVDALLADVDGIFLPNMSLNAAVKIGRLEPDSLVCILAVRGLLRGLPVTASRDSLLPAGLELQRVPAGVRQRLEGLLADLAGLGVRVVPVDGMLGGSAAVGGSTAKPECTMTEAGECGGCGKCVEKSPHAVRALVSSGAERIAAAAGTRPASSDIAAAIDHTLLKPDATEAEIRKLCEEARQYVFASVCVNPSWVGTCAKLLAGSPVKVCTVIGFPLGATTSTAKSVETRDAIANGATEIDMVINVGALKSGDDDLVRRDIEAVVGAAQGQALVKVILETALLSREEKIKACLLAKMAGADFVKTSTGFSSGGATVEDIALMRETVGPEMGVKASGGIRDRATAEAMVAAGATRIGASASVAIATGKKPSGKGY